MGQVALYKEERIFNRHPYDALNKAVQFHHWMDSIFYPGFVGKSAGGQYAMYQYMESGTLRTGIDNREIFTGCGTFSISLGRQKYDWIKCDSDEPVKRQCFSVYHSPFHDYLVREFFTGSGIKIVLTAPEKVLDIMQKIKAELAGEQAAGKLAALHMELLCELALQQRKIDYPEEFNAILQYINNNLHSPQLGRESVAAHFNISTRSLTRLFKKYLASSPGRYIIEQRLTMVKSRLAVENLPLKEIAWACGFSSVNFMVRQFRQNYHITPGEYRREYSGKKVF